MAPKNTELRSRKRQKTEPLQQHAFEPWQLKLRALLQTKLEEHCYLYKFLEFRFPDETSLVEFSQQVDANFQPVRADLFSRVVSDGPLVAKVVNVSFDYRASNRGYVDREETLVLFDLFCAKGGFHTDSAAHPGAAPITTCEIDQRQWLTGDFNTSHPQPKLPHTLLPAKLLGLVKGWLRIQVAWFFLIGVIDLDLLKDVPDSFKRTLSYVCCYHQSGQSRETQISTHRSITLGDALTRRTPNCWSLLFQAESVLNVQGGSIDGYLSKTNQNEIMKSLYVGEKETLALTNLIGRCSAKFKSICKDGCAKWGMSHRGGPLSHLVLGSECVALNWTPPAAGEYLSTVLSLSEEGSELLALRLLGDFERMPLPLRRTHTIQDAERLSGLCCLFTHLIGKYKTMVPNAVERDDDVRYLYEKFMRKAMDTDMIEALGSDVDVPLASIGLFNALLKKRSNIVAQTHNKELQESERKLMAATYETLCLNLAEDCAASRAWRLAATLHALQASTFLFLSFLTASVVFV